MEMRLTELLSSLTYYQKPHGTLNACRDPRNLNKAILQEHYKALTLNMISDQLSGAHLFSKLDAKNGLWSVHPNKPSSRVTTFNTHKGRYRFLYIPFGLKMSQDVFQMQRDHITNMLLRITAIHDDICVFCKAPQEHINILIHLMETATKMVSYSTVSNVDSNNLKSLLLCSLYKE